MNLKKVLDYYFVLNTLFLSIVLLFCLVVEDIYYTCFGDLLGWIVGCVVSLNCLILLLGAIFFVKNYENKNTKSLFKKLFIYIIFIYIISGFLYAMFFVTPFAPPLV